MIGHLKEYYTQAEEVHFLEKENWKSVYLQEIESAI